MACATLLPWSAGLGLALGAFWLTREEGVWILPVLVFLYAAGAWQYARERGSWRKYSAVYGVPLLLWGACLLAVAELNSAYYKTFSTVETKQADFVAAMARCRAIREGAWLPTTPVVDRGAAAGVPLQSRVRRIASPTSKAK